MNTQNPLPLDWRQVELGSVSLELYGGGTPSTKNPTLWNGSIPWITSKRLGDALLIDSGEKFISEKALTNSATKVATRGSLLTATRVGVGKVGIAEIDVAINQDISAIIVDPLVCDVRFIAYQLKSELVQLEFAKHRRGATIQGITRDNLRDIPLALPPFQEQRNIASVLTLVQQSIEQQQRLIELTNELKHTLMHKLFTEGLNGEPQKQTEIGPIPESWTLRLLGSLAKVGNGSTPKRGNAEYWMEGDTPWLNSAKIHDLFIHSADQFVTPVAVKECHLPLVPAGSLLIAITGQGKTLGNSAIVRFDTTINQHLAYAKFTTDEVLPEFVLWYMQTRYEYLRSIAQAGGSTKGALTCGFLKTIMIPIPTFQEQEQIVEIFDLLYRRMQIIESKHKALTELFDSLLHQLMTATVRVDDLDLSVLEGS